MIKIIGGTQSVGRLRILFLRITTRQNITQKYLRKHEYLEHH